MSDMMLDYSTFFKQQAYIDGRWCTASDAIDVMNPANQQVLGSVPNMGVVETELAIAAAARALPSWRQLSALERGNYLLKWHDLMLAHKEALATLLSLEQGKPWQEAVSEIEYGASYFRWFAEEGRRAYGDTIPSDKPNLRYLVFKQAIGVVAAITPWNFPNAMIARKCAPALAAGCTIVIKPSELTPFSALAMAVLAEQAGIPAGVINIVTGDAQAIGATFCQSSVVKKLSFTGSTRVGKLLYQQCSATVKKLSLELGGNAPVLVFDDADLDKTVTQVLATKFRNSGQTCVCANRILVQTGIYDAFVEALVKKVRALRVDTGLADSKPEIGPLINVAAIDKIQTLVKEAVDQGAQVLCGGGIHPQGPQFYEPTVLVGGLASMNIAQQEIFGPVAVIYPFVEESDAIAEANAVPVGLASYCFTSNLQRLWRVAEQLEFGIVSVNTGLFSNAAAPFGGMKESGLGREGSKYGLDDYLEIKYVCLDIGS